MSESRRYIGVDLGAWSGTKTRIAVLRYDGQELKLLKIKKEPTASTEDPGVRNQKLKDCLLKISGSKDTVIAIDAPFAIPSLLGCFKSIEKYYPYERSKNKESISQNKKNNDKKFAIQNQYLYDNSARYVYEKTQQRVLAPTATLVGALTSRMIHMVDNYFDILGVCKTPDLENKKRGVLAVEVFPTATLFQIVKSRKKENRFNANEYLEHYTNDEKDSEEFTKIISYKKTKGKPAHFNDNKKRMLDLIKPYLTNSIEDLIEKIETDDDYDATICALTAYWVDKKDGYEKPKNDLDKFTNSFIYIPKID